MKKIIFTILIVFGATVTMANDNALNEYLAKEFEKQFEKEKATEKLTFLGKTYNKNTRTLTYHWLDKTIDFRGLSKAQISKNLNAYRETFMNTLCTKERMQAFENISNFKIRNKFYDLNEFQDVVVVFGIADCKGRY